MEKLNGSKVQGSIGPVAVVGDTTIAEHAKRHYFSYKGVVDSKAACTAEEIRAALDATIAALQGVRSRFEPSEFTRSERFVTASAATFNRQVVAGELPAIAAQYSGMMERATAIVEHKEVPSASKVGKAVADALAKSGMTLEQLLALAAKASA